MILMKIIVRDETGIKKCLIQFRDVLYLEKRFNTRSIRKFISLSFEEKVNEESFVEVRNRDIAKAIEAIPYIVDFSEMAKYDCVTLSRLIVLANSQIANEKQKLDEEKKVEDLQDIISFNNGTLTYVIPVMFDGKSMTKNDDIVFGSTTLPGYYLLKSSDKDFDYNSYILENAHSLFECVCPDQELISFQTTKLNDGILIHFKGKRKLFGSKKKNNI